MDLFLKSVYGSYCMFIIIFRKSRSFHKTLYQVLLLYLPTTPGWSLDNCLTLHRSVVQQRLGGTDSTPSRHYLNAPPRRKQVRWKNFIQIKPDHIIPIWIFTIQTSRVPEQPASNHDSLSEFKGKKNHNMMTFEMKPSLIQFHWASIWRTRLTAHEKSVNKLKRKHSLTARNQRDWFLIGSVGSADTPHLVQSKLD